jgi:hypothetical protein
MVSARTTIITSISSKQPTGAWTVQTLRADICLGLEACGRSSTMRRLRYSTAHVGGGADLTYGNQQSLPATSACR